MIFAIQKNKVKIEIKLFLLLKITIRPILWALPSILT